jgi:hypothetical protein
MKKTLLLLIVFALPIWMYSQATSPVVEEAVSSTFDPGLPLLGALEKAEAYLNDQGPDLTRFYLESVRLLNDSGGDQNGYYWRLEWGGMKSGSEKGCVLRVYMDGRVIPEKAGAGLKG